MSRKRLIIIAPNDRYNYGDLLFSHIIKFQLADLYDEVVNVATIEADLVKVGGDVVKSIDYTYNLSDDCENHIIVAGGESFFSQWYNALSYLNKAFYLRTRFIVKLLQKLNLQEIYYRYSVVKAKTLLGATTDFPYTIGKHEIRNVERIFYNALGASWIDNSFFYRKSIKKILSNVDYLSLRDERSNKSIIAAGFNSFLVPDCAAIMSEYYDDDFLLNKVHSEIANFSLTNKGKYLTFQINRSLGTTHFKDVISFLRGFYLQYKMPICLCPVGFALGHEDDVILEKVSVELKRSNIPFFFRKELKIWDIMFLISKSAIYVGTSLHGAITSMSYKVPYIGIYVTKTMNYIETWGMGTVGTSNNLDVLPKIEYLLTNPEVLDKLLSTYENQKTSIENSFLRMKMIIEDRV